MGDAPRRDGLGQNGLLARQDQRVRDHDVPARGVEVEVGFDHTRQAHLSPPVRVLLILASLVVVIAGLKAAQAILIPVLLALLLAILCTPAVYWLRDHRVPTVAAVLLVVVALLGVFAGFGALVGGSVNGFIEAAPRYQERLDAVGTSIGSWLQLRGVDTSRIHASNVFQPGALVRVLGGGLSALLSTLSNTFVVVLILVFMLLEALSLPTKMRVATNRPDVDLHRFTKAAREIQKYLGLKTAISALTGLLIGGWVAVLGLDFALTWGFLAFLLNFIPNIGSIIAAIPAVLLALVQLGLAKALLVALGFVVVNVLLGNIVEPQLMGRTLGMSTLAIFLSLVFWGWLWGPVGMFLSVPLTMILKIGMENSRDLKPIAILLDSADATAARLQAETPDDVAP